MTLIVRGVDNTCGMTRSRPEGGPAFRCSDNIIVYLQFYVHC